MSLNSYGYEEEDLSEDAETVSINQALCVQDLDSGAGSDTDGD